MRDLTPTKRFRHQQPEKAGVCHFGRKVSWNPPPLVDFFYTPGDFFR